MPGDIFDMTLETFLDTIHRGSLSKDGNFQKLTGGEYWATKHANVCVFFESGE